MNTEVEINMATVDESLAEAIPVFVVVTVTEVTVSGPPLGGGTVFS